MQDGVYKKRMKMNKSSQSQIFQIGLYLLFWLMLGLMVNFGAGYAQPEIIPLMEEQQVPQKFVSLVVKKDICTLLDHCLVTPAIDASGYSDLELAFKQYVDDFQGLYFPYDLKVQVTTDGGSNWADAWSISPTANIGPETVTVDLSAYDGQTFQLAWVFIGYSYDIDHWYIDDIVVTGS